MLIKIAFLIFVMTKEFPLSAEENTAILALGGIDRVVATVETILDQHGIHRSIFLGSDVNLIRRQQANVDEAIYFAFDPSKSVASNLADLFRQASDIQKNSGGANYVGAMLQHLVGAKLDLVLGVGVAEHHGFSVADHSTARVADFQVNGVAIHVTTHPSEALIRKAASNMNSGIKPVIVTLAEGVEGAHYLLKATEWKDRIDVLDAAQFLTANVYERSLFHAHECKTTLSGILQRYNEIVEACETDPVLRIRL